jgi:biopolymer transport protein ExbB
MADLFYEIEEEPGASLFLACGIGGAGTAGERRGRAWLSLSGRGAVLLASARLACTLLIAGIVLLGTRAASAQPASGAGDDLKNATTVDVAEPGSAAIAPKPAVQGAGAAQRAAVDRSSILRPVLNANPMLWPLAICSVVTLGYVLERWLALRRDRVVPREFADRFLERLSSGKLDRERALELCRAHDSPAARVFAMVVGAWGQSGAAIRQMVSHDAAGEVVELKRNLRILSAVATLGPLLGLLGTVVGIIQSFDALGGRIGPARGEMLARGISLALVATAFGLGIAIVAVTFYYFFLNRVDVLIRELDDRTRQVIELVSSESQRMIGADRRHVPPGAAETHRHESRVI